MVVRITKKVTAVVKIRVDGITLVHTVVVVIIIVVVVVVVAKAVIVVLLLRQW